jgi:hypothetical protein
MARIALLVVIGVLSTGAALAAPSPPSWPPQTPWMTPHPVQVRVWLVRRLEPWLYVTTQAAQRLVNSADDPSAQHRMMFCRATFDATRPPADPGITTVVGRMREACKWFKRAVNDYNAGIDRHNVTLVAFSTSDFNRAGNALRSGLQAIAEYRRNH